MAFDHSAPHLPVQGLSFRDKKSLATASSPILAWERPHRLLVDLGLLLAAALEDLPLSLVDIAETLGMGVAIKLMQHFGGLEVQLPRVPPPDHPVIAALGETDGYALCELLSGVRASVGLQRRAQLAHPHDLRDQPAHQLHGRAAPADA